MRYLTLSFSPDIYGVDVLEGRGEIMNIQSQADGTTLELLWMDGDSERLISDLESDPDTRTIELLQRDGTRHYFYRHTTQNGVVRSLLDLFDEFRLMLIFPVRFDTENGITLNLVGTPEMLRSAYDNLPPDVQRHATIERLRQFVPALAGLQSALTERQREVLEAAIEVGYYSVPRTGTSADVALAVGCAQSTAATHLQKIESRILSQIT